MLSSGKRVAGSGWATTTGVGGLGGSGAATTGEERGCGEGISCAGFVSCPDFCVSFFATPFCRSPNPFPDQGLSLIQNH
jgi:hypothetical protein